MIELNLKLISNAPTKLIFVPTKSLEDVHSFIFASCEWKRDNYYLLCNGKEISHIQEITGQIQVIPRLRGGKGGFGSMLRAIGAQIEKTTNREACRDLSGRRLRDINEEQRLKKWITQQTEREKEIEERRKKKLEKLSSEPKHEFQDEQYFTERSEMSNKLNDAFEQGMQATTSTNKRKSEVKDTKIPNKKKKKLLDDFDEFSSSDDAEDESDHERKEIHFNDNSETKKFSNIHSEKKETETTKVNC